MAAIIKKGPMLTSKAAIKTMPVMINNTIDHNPYFIKDWDDEFDNTYAYAEFHVPKEYEEELKKMATGIKPLSIGEKFQGAFKEMEAMTPEQLEKDERFAPTIKMLRGVIEE